MNAEAVAETADSAAATTATATAATDIAATAAGRGSLTRAELDGGKPRQSAANLREALAPLVLDVAVPLGTYYLAHSAFGLSTMTALMVSSIVPAIRTVAGLFRKREWNALATLMLVVNLAGIALTFFTGDARLMLAKDSALSSVIGIGMLVSVFAGRPVMSSALKPMLTKGDAAKDAAWSSLSAESAAFQRLEQIFTLIWGCCLLADCVARFIGAFTLPVATMAWLGTVILLVAIALGIVIGGLASSRMDRMVAEQTEHAEHAAQGA